MKMLRGTLGKRFFSCVGAGLAVCVFFTGCQVKLPVFVADDNSVTERLQDGLSDISIVAGTVDYGYKRTTDGQEVTSSVNGSFEGDVSDKLDLNFESSDVLTEGVSDNQAKDVTEHRMILDTQDDLLYSQVNKDWTVYLDAMSMVDVKWWKAFFKTFGYDGKGSLDESGRSGYLLGGSVKGEKIDDLLGHLHIQLGGSFDSGDSELQVNICLDEHSGIPYAMSLSLADNGAVIQILDDEGTVWNLDDLHLDIVFQDVDPESDIEIQVPEEAKTIDPVSPSADMVVESDGLSNKQVIVSPDEKWKATFLDQRVFDDVDISKKDVMTVKSTNHVAGDPVITLKYVSGADAYNSVITDQQVALEYYNQEQALSEVYVSEKVTACTISGRPAYSYIQQYSDMSYGFVNTDHCTYVDLGNDQYLKIQISSMVDLGVSTVLTEDYAQSILKNVKISEV